MTFVQDFAEAMPQFGSKLSDGLVTVAIGMLLTVLLYAAFALRAYRRTPTRNWRSITRHSANLLTLLSLQLAGPCFVGHLLLQSQVRVHESATLFNILRLDAAFRDVCTPGQAGPVDLPTSEASLRSPNALWSTESARPMKALDPSAPIPCSSPPLYNMLPEMKEASRLSHLSHRVFLGGAFSLAVGLLTAWLSVGLQLCGTAARRSKARGEGEEQSAFKAKW